MTSWRPSWTLNYFQVAAFFNSEVVLLRGVDWEQSFSNHADVSIVLAFMFKRNSVLDFICHWTFLDPASRWHRTEGELEQHLAKQCPDLAWDRDVMRGLYMFLIVFRCLSLNITQQCTFVCPMLRYLQLWLLQMSSEVCLVHFRFSTLANAWTAGANIACIDAMVCVTFIRIQHPVTVLTLQKRPTFHPTISCMGVHLPRCNRQ